MPRDYVWIDVNLFAHPKVRKLIRNGGPEALVGWLKLLLWARRMADEHNLGAAGVMCREDAEDEAGGKEIVEAVLDARLADETLDGTVVLHDFAEHQHLAEWAAKLAAGRRGGRTRGAQLKAQAQAHAKGEPEGTFKPSPHHTTPHQEIEPNGSIPATPTARAQAVAKAAYDHTNGMVNFAAVQSLAKRAITKGGYTDDEVQSAVLAVIDDDRPITAETLRVQLVKRARGPEAREVAPDY